MIFSEFSVTVYTYVREFQVREVQFDPYDPFFDANRAEDLEIAEEMLKQFE